VGIMNKKFENTSISANNQILKIFIVGLGYLMLVLSFYLISISCNALESNIRYLNLSLSLPTKIILSLFGTSSYKILFISIIIMPFVFFFYNYIKSEKDLNFILTILYFMLSFIFLFISFVLAAFTTPFLRITGTLH